MSSKRLAQLLDEEGHLRGTPELIVEVLYPGTTNEPRDRQVKLKLTHPQESKNIGLQIGNYNS
ncbi:hypothetical protein [Nostoc sp.]|uniref:hypothetical protein n=1 Tax=Nostoc sp. TaxID=1180 RepID=UPI003FA59BB7